MKPREIHPQNITSERERAGLTQAQLAELCGVSQTFVALVEGGKKAWPAARLDSLNRALAEGRKRREQDRERIHQAMKAVRRSEYTG